MSIRILCAVIFLCFIQLSAQSQTDSIVVKKILGGIGFFQNGKSLTPRKMLNLMEDQPEAQAEMRIAKKNYIIDLLTGGPGGFCLGWSLGMILASKTPNNAILATGVVLTGISIPFKMAYESHARKASSIYNKGIKKFGVEELNFKIGLCSNGLGLKIDF